MIDEIAKESLLFDFYGGLLTARKQQALAMHQEEDLSLSEIAEELGISRAAVHERIRSAQSNLREYEEKLGLVELFLEREGKISLLREELKRIRTENSGDRKLAARLEGLEKIISSLEP